jgi:hypothetical protein
MTSSSFVATPLGNVPKDGAYSSLFGSNVTARKGVATVASNYRDLQINDASIDNMTATTINGSSNISLIDCNPNELLATNATLGFVSIPHTLAATANTVPIRSSQFTNFNQLTLTANDNQITGNVAPNSTVVTVPSPASSRLYQIQLEGPDGGGSITVVSTTTTTGFGFLDNSITVTQLGVKSSSANALLNVNSGVGANSLLQTWSDDGELWSIGNFQTDDTFRLNYDFIPNNDYINVADAGANATFTVKGHILPSQVMTALGTDAKRWDSFCIAEGANTLTDVVDFTGVEIVANGMRTITVNNTMVTATSSILAQVHDFDGASFTGGFPYPIVSNVGVGSFDLNVFNTSITNSISAVSTVSVRYWIVATV